jgi:hypothetical protein
MAMRNAHCKAKMMTKDYDYEFPKLFDFESWRYYALDLKLMAGIQRYQTTSLAQ